MKYSNKIFEDKFKFLEALYLFVDMTYDLTPDSLRSLCLDRKVADYFDVVTKLGYETWINDSEFLYGLAYVLIYYEDYIDQEFVNKIKKQMEVTEIANILFDVYSGRKKVLTEEKEKVFKELIKSQPEVKLYLKKYGKLAEYIVETHWQSSVTLLE
jgi:hypothetical protein